YLGPARKRPNLTIRTGVCVRRIVIEGGRAVGVEILERGQVRIERAEQEIVVAAGALNSPKLLLLSGVGPAKGLSSVGVKTIVDLPGVGQNLHDHLDIFL